MPPVVEVQWQRMETPELLPKDPLDGSVRAPEDSDNLGLETTAPEQLKSTRMEAWKASMTLGASSG